jgi:AAA family ATP:ADP antiporter
MRAAVTGATVTAIAMIAYQVAAKATRDAFFLSTFYVTALPAMMIATSILAIAVAFAFTRALNAWGPQRVIPIGFAGSATLLLVEWALSFPLPRPAAILVYLHYGCLGALLISGFWSYLSERFDPRTAKRLAGRITAAGAIGGVLGGMVASQVGRGLPVTTMIPILAIFHFVCAASVMGLRSAASPTRSTIGTEPPRRSNVRVLAESSYLRGLIALVLLVTLSEGLIDLVLKGRAALTLGQGGALLQFFAAFYTGVALLTVVAQVTMGRIALERLGPARAAAILPVATAAAAAGASVAPVLGSAVVARGLESVLANSVYRSGYEVLFTPVPAREKRAVKAIADVGASRLGDFLAAAIAQVVVLITMTRPGQILAAIATLCSLAGAWIAFRLHAGYSQSLARGLVSRAVQLDLSEVRDVSTRTTVLQTLGPLALSQIQRIPDRGETPTSRPVGGRSERQLDATADSDTTTASVEENPESGRVRGLHSRDRDIVIGALEAGPLPAALIPQVVPLLAWDDVARQAIDALRQAGPVQTELLVARLLDQDEDFTIRRRIPLVLATYKNRVAVEGLAGALSDRRFEVRYRSGRALTHLADMDPTLTISRDAALQAVVRELVSGTGVWGSRNLLDRMDDEGWSPVMDQFLRDRANRSLEHVFTLLAFALPREPLRIAFRGLHTDDPLLRGTALEYLESTLPPEIRKPLWPYLEDDRPKRAGAVLPAADALHELLRSNESIVIRLEELRQQGAREEGRSN